MAKRGRKSKAVHESKHGDSTNSSGKLDSSSLNSSQTGFAANSDSKDNFLEMKFTSISEGDKLFQVFKKYLPAAKAQLATKLAEEETVSKSANADKLESSKDLAEKHTNESFGLSNIKSEINPQQSFYNKPTEDAMECLNKSNKIFNPELNNSDSISGKRVSFDYSKANSQESQDPLPANSDFTESRNVTSKKLNSISSSLCKIPTEETPKVKEEPQINSATNEENEPHFVFADNNGFIEFNEDPINRLKAVSADLFKMCWVDLSPVESQAVTIADPVNKADFEPNACQIAHPQVKSKSLQANGLLQASKSDQSSDPAIGSEPNHIICSANEPESTSTGVETSDKQEFNNHEPENRSAPPVAKYSRCFLRLVRVLQPDLYEFIGESGDIVKITKSIPKPIVRSVKPLRHTQQKPQITRGIGCQNHCTPTVRPPVRIHFQPTPVPPKSTLGPGCSIRRTARDPSTTVAVSYSIHRQCHLNTFLEKRNLEFSNKQSL
ncbi:hypothetical protein Aperf_G00000064435 [Anoplocephala perfoliata]